MDYMWREYVSIGERRIKAKKEMEKLKKKGKTIEPVHIDGKKITQKYWGNKWCAHIETFADHANRLPRGRTYVRNGSVCHLNIVEGYCEAIVAGSELYKVLVKIQKLKKKKWETIKKDCKGEIGSVLEILQGKISHQVMKVVSDHNEGLFPNMPEINYTCTCPDSAYMCKHVAAVLYGIGNRLDTRPELLFVLRGVDVSELVTTTINIEGKSSTDQFESDELSKIFDIEFDVASNNRTLKEDNIKITKIKKEKKK